MTTQDILTDPMIIAGVTLFIVGAAGMRWPIDNDFDTVED